MLRPAYKAIAPMFPEVSLVGGRNENGSMGSGYSRVWTKPTATSGAASPAASRAERNTRCVEGHKGQETLNAPVMTVSPGSASANALMYSGCAADSAAETK